MDVWTRRALAVVVVWSAGAGCDSAEDRCEAARAEADRAWGAYVDAALPGARAATQARDRALDEVVRALMDLGNLRTEGSEGSEGARHEAFVGIEVSIGAVIGAVLAVGELYPEDPEAAQRIADALTEELDGRFADLMTAPLDGDEQLERIHDLGDACATRVQLLVRDQPEAVRARVLASFEALRAAEAAPAAGVTLESVRAKWRALLDAARVAREAQERLDAAVAARDAVREPSDRARAAAAAVPAGDGSELAAARTASEQASRTCAEAGL